MAMPLSLSGMPAGLRAAMRTPEPMAVSPTAADEARPPSPPRPRLRLKRRAVPHLSAPTQNFLASVAAADVPIPSIEVPELDDPLTGLALSQQQQQQSHPSLFQFGDLDGNLLSVRGRNTFSPPKTPAPGTVPSSAAPSRYPDWSIDSAFSSSAESSPDRECASSSRPSTARSTQTSSSSLFSRFSQLSDDDRCVSPEEEASFKSRLGLRGQLKELRRNPTAASLFSSAPEHGRDARDERDDDRPSSNRKHSRKAQWTKAMSSHLWATYILYLQDPKVTPFRVGKSCVPPHGVLLRVAREAKRSWKGPKALAKTSSSTSTSDGSAASLTVPTSAPGAAAASTAASSAWPEHAANKSGSTTPTAAESHAGSTFIEWPFTNAATRAHLRELCRLKAATPGGGARSLQYMSRSPTPFTQTAATRHRNATRVTPGALTSSSSFATQDMVLSLSLSTSETMQPQGPLAQLTRSGSDWSQRLDAALVSGQDHSAASASLSSASDLAPTGATAQGFLGQSAPAMGASDEPSFAERRRLGSPFTARSYGPSSSSSLAAILGLSASANTRQPHTIGPRRSLQSPVRLSRSGTQKRRTKHLSQDLRRRPGLASDFFTEPSDMMGASFHSVDEGSVSYRSAAVHNEELFIPRPETVPTLTSSCSAPQLTIAPAAVTLEEAVQDSERLQPMASPARDVDSYHTPGLLDAAPLLPPARLGSPFSSLPGRNTFPNRFSQPADFDMASLGRPFASVQRIAQPRAVPARNPASRLADIERRLRELNNRHENLRRGPDSPL